MLFKINQPHLVDIYVIYHIRLKRGFVHLGGVLQGYVQTGYVM